MRRWAVWSASFALAAAAPAWAASPPAPEVGRYSFQAFAPGGTRGVLPAELLRPASVTPLVPAADQTVEITWETLEPRKFSGYRVTTLMEGPGFAPIVARWTVDPWSGAPGALPSQRLYRLRLPVLGRGSVRLRTTLEALHTLRAPVVLGVRESLASSSAVPGWLGSSRPPRLESRASVGEAVAPRETAAAPAADATSCVAESATLHEVIPARCFLEASAPPRPRGPPVPS